MGGNIGINEANPTARLHILHPKKEISGFKLDDGYQERGKVLGQ